MKRTLLTTSVVLILLVFGAVAIARPPFGGDGYGMGRGMGMMAGMMGGGGPGFGGPDNCPYHDLTIGAAPITKDEAAAILQNHLKWTRNPNLKLGKITEKETGFEAEIVTKDNSLVNKIFIDKETGRTKPIYN
ncbi:MAG: hypothetical protein HZC10_05645 [Nitrospirae bacterium]|nr:hypothetical protein [Nitrospirota bacterium]